MSDPQQVVIVTGVTSGVGQGIARTLARQGWPIVGTGRRAERGKAFETAMRAEGCTVDFVVADVRVVTDCERVVATAMQIHGRVDVLVNNAAVIGQPPLVDAHAADESWWDAVLDTNLKGAFFCSRFALGAMIEQGAGNIVNVASVMGLNIGPPRMAAYTVSKAGLIALTKTLAVEYADRGIRCNALILGGAEGESAYQLYDARAIEQLGGSYAPVPYDERNTGRITGEELADIVLFVCGNAGRHINGAAIPVDRGISAGLISARAMASTPLA